MQSIVKAFDLPKKKKRKTNIAFALEDAFKPMQKHIDKVKTPKLDVKSASIGIRG